MAAIQPVRSGTPHAICGAKTRSGDVCRARPMSNGRCRMHGGSSLRGTASPTFKTGKHSKYMPARLLDRYEESLTDPNLAALKAELAVIDARLSDLLSRIDNGEDGTLWARLRGSWGGYESALAKGDEAAAQYNLQRVGEMITQGAQDEQTWTEIGAWIEQRRRVAESEYKRDVALQTMVPIEQLLAFMARFAAGIPDRVSLESDRRALSEFIIELISMEER